MESFGGAPLAGLGRTSVQLDANQRAPLALEINEPGRYRIDATAVHADLDPVMYLYQVQPDGFAVDAIAYDDDTGDGFNSRIEMELQADISYYLEIEEISGFAGEFNVAIQTVE